MLIFQSIMDRPVGLPLFVFQSTTNRPDADISIHKGPASGNASVYVSISNQPAGCLIFQSIMDRLVGLPLSVYQSTTNQPDDHISIPNGPAGGTPTVCILINNQPAG